MSPARTNSTYFESPKRIKTSIGILVPEMNSRMGIAIICSISYLSEVPNVSLKKVPEIDQSLHHFEPLVDLGQVSWLSSHSMDVTITSFYIFDKMSRETVQQR